MLNLCYTIERGKKMKKTQEQVNYMQDLINNSGLSRLGVSYNYTKKEFHIYDVDTNSSLIKTPYYKFAFHFLSGMLSLANILDIG